MSSVSRTTVLSATRAPTFTSRPGVCRRLEDQTGSSCFTSSAAFSRSPNSTNCFNNNAMRGLASQSDAVGIRGGGIPHHSFPAQGLFTGKWEGRCQLQFTGKEHQGGCPRRGKRGWQEEESPIMWCVPGGVIATAAATKLTSCTDGMGYSEGKTSKMGRSCLCGRARKTT